MSGESSPASQKIGDLLVQDGYLRPAQLEEVLKIQAEQDSYIPLGRICVEQGLISSRELKQFLRKHHKRMYLGELLQNLGLLKSNRAGSSAPLAEN